MGLFGLFATIFTAGVATIDAFKEANYVGNQRRQANESGKITYSDRKGNDYLTSTDEAVYYHGGKIYSKKNPTVVVCDPRIEHYRKFNEEAIAKAKNSGQKRVILYFPKENSPQGYAAGWVEVSTQRKFDVSVVTYFNREIGNWDFSFFKQYLTNDEKPDGNSIKITREEFNELGGYLPHGMTASEYIKKERKEREKMYKKW